MKDKRINPKPWIRGLRKHRETRFHKFYSEMVQQCSSLTKKNNVINFFSSASMKVRLQITCSLVCFSTTGVNFSSRSSHTTSLYVRLSCSDWFTSELSALQTETLVWFLQIPLFLLTHRHLQTLWNFPASHNLTSITNDVLLYSDVSWRVRLMFTFSLLLMCSNWVLVVSVIVPAIKITLHLWLYWIKIVRHRPYMRTSLVIFSKCSQFECALCILECEYRLDICN